MNRSNICNRLHCNKLPTAGYIQNVQGPRIRRLLFFFFSGIVKRATYMYAHVLVKRNSRRRWYIDGSVALNASGIRVKECCLGGASLKKNTVPVEWCRGGDKPHNNAGKGKCFTFWRELILTHARIFCLLYNLSRILGTIVYVVCRDRYWLVRTFEAL